MSVMIVIRSIVFNVAFYINLIIYIVAALPTLVMPRWGIIALAKSWGRTSNRLMRAICGISVEVRGRDKIPPGALIVAAKHQSVWETFTLLTLLDDPTYILKRELTWIPLFGWYLLRAGMIPVNRGARAQALARMTERARFELSRGRQIIIFPEGTRRPPGAEPAYKYGVVNLYAETGAACLPVALNSGLFWPRRKFLRYPGVIILQVLDPIPPGLDKGAFAERLKRDIESATAQLIAEGKRELAGKLAEN
jgi:1-acyl-sn-glycerol-3-phosphate acyltransferase